MRSASALGVFVLSTSALGVFAYNNGVQRTPVLGWNTWCTLSDCHNGDNDFFDRCVVLPRAAAPLSAS